MAHTITITNPETNRDLRLRAWSIEPRRVLDGLKSGQIKSAKDISWSLLGDADSICEMHETDGGECASENWALSILENALDWTLGMAVLNTIRAAAKIGKMPKPFQVGCSRKGNVYVVYASGKVFKAA